MEKPWANECYQLQMEFPELEISIVGTGIFTGSLEVTKNDSVKDMGFC